MLRSAARRIQSQCQLRERGSASARCCLSGWGSLGQPGREICDSGDQPARPQRPVPANRQGMTELLPALPPPTIWVLKLPHAVKTHGSSIPGKGDGGSRRLRPTHGSGDALGVG